MINKIFLLTFVILFAIVFSAGATTLNFEGIFVVGSAYNNLGISFNPSSQQVCPGISNGDPGNWDLEGTNGPFFLCFNHVNPGLTMELIFAVPQSAISLDVSRAGGTSPGQTFTLNVYDGQTLLATKTVSLLPINSWNTVSITTSIEPSNRFNRVTWKSTDSYGVDNLVFFITDTWKGHFSFPLKYTIKEKDASGKQTFLTYNQMYAGTMKLYVGGDNGLELESDSGCFMRLFDDDQQTDTEACISGMTAISTESEKSKSEKTLLVGTGHFQTFLPLFPGIPKQGQVYIDGKATMKQDSSNNLISIGLTGKIGGGAISDDVVFSGTINNTTLTKQAAP